MTPPSGAQIIVYLARPGLIADASLEQRVVQCRGCAVAVDHELAHVREVEQAAAFLTALCSAVSLPYRSGISQPAKSVMAAPRSLCTAASGVFRGAGDGESGICAAYRCTCRERLQG